ncbi:hypothetical protein [Neobacillus jeddahensis]|uniref:hypothetical protein n=1 Tax=Neobacillus jeddahensis TaxID=1461580 RepID=UPI0005909969|nr:hypothetical protein [Neobacillus jeddahensis]
MEKYFINYHTGAGNLIVEVNEIDEAKRIAEEGVAYTQTQITIETLDGEVITESRWWGVEPEEDSNVLEIIGDGYFQTWSDELENEVY